MPPSLARDQELDRIAAAVQRRQVRAGGLEIDEPRDDSLAPRDRSAADRHLCACRGVRRSGRRRTAPRVRDVTTDLVLPLGRLPTNDGCDEQATVPFALRMSRWLRSAPAMPANDSEQPSGLVNTWSIVGLTASCSTDARTSYEVVAQLLRRRRGGKSGLCQCGTPTISFRLDAHIDGGRHRRDDEEADEKSRNTPESTSDECEPCAAQRDAALSPAFYRRRDAMTGRPWRQSSPKNVSTDTRKHLSRATIPRGRSA